MRKPKFKVGDYFYCNFKYFNNPTIILAEITQVNIESYEFCPITKQANFKENKFTCNSIMAFKVKKITKKTS